MHYLCSVVNRGDVVVPSFIKRKRGNMDIELSDKIDSFLAKFFEDKNLFLVETVVSGNRINVFIDGITTNITIKECASTSRAIEDYLETNQLVPEKYFLEVSSPGLDKPLKLPQQFIKAIGRDVVVKMLDGKKVEGTLQSYQEESITIVTIPKTKKEEALTLELKFEEIKSVKHLIKFK